MKKITGVFAALLMSGSVMAVDQPAEDTLYCEPMISNHSTQIRAFGAFAIKFYLTDESGYEACREIATKDGGAKVIVSPGENSLFTAMNK